MSAKQNLVGVKFHNLTVVKDTGVRQCGKVMWECLCVCGNTVKVTTGNLKSKIVISCGCARIKHGMHKTKIYQVWASMKWRCASSLSEYYHNRGIQVSERWSLFENFLEDMGPTYAEGLSLDRIDNDGGYCKENCRWTNRSVQSRNRRKSKRNKSSIYRNVTFDGNCGKNGKYAVRVRLLDGTNHKTEYFDSEFDAAKRVDEIIEEYNLPNIKNFKE